MPIRRYDDWSGRPDTLQTAVIQAHEQIGFRDPFGLEFSREWLQANDLEKQLIAKEMAVEFIKNDMKYIERKKRLVRMNPIFEGRDFMLDAGLVFVLSPFKEPFDTIFVDHIKKTVEAIDDLQCIRGDDIFDNRSVIEDIWKSINEAHIIIADLTERNPNVLYETGVAHTVGKEVILVTQSMEDIPFDLQYLRCIPYDYTPRGAKKLEADLEATIRNIRKRMPQS